MIARALTVVAKSNLKLTQKCMDRIYLRWKCDIFKIDNSLVCQILSTIFTNMEAYVYMN